MGQPQQQFPTAIPGGLRGNQPVVHGGQHVVLHTPLHEDIVIGNGDQEEDCPPEKSLTNFQCKFGILCLSSIFFFRVSDAYLFFTDWHPFEMNMDPDLGLYFLS